MGDWIHCNECVARFRSNLKFFLTECGHLYCGKCAEKVMHLRTCSVCNKKTSVLQLSKEVELNILEYFMPVEAMIKKTCEVIQFQNLHRNLLFNALLKKYNSVKKECINANNTIKRVMKENHELKSLLSGGSSGGRGPYVTSTPASQKSSTLFHNNSMLSSIAPAPSFGSAEPRDRNPQIFPGYARRVSMKSAFDVSSTHGPSPAHVVPIHRGGHHARTAYSLEELRRGKSK